MRALFLTIVISMSALFSQFPDYITDGIVYSVESDSSWAYIGGRFKKVGIYTGKSSAISTENGKSNLTWPKFNLPVRKIINDGSDGWFVGGEFRYVNYKPERHIVRVKSDMTVDENWSYDPVGFVKTMYLKSDTLFVGHYIGVTGSYKIVALNAANGSQLSWSMPTVKYSNSTVAINSMEALNGVLYLGGIFSAIGDSARTNLAAINISDGSLHPWNPKANSAINKLHIHNKDSIFVAGNFTTIKGKSITGFAILEADTGIANSLLNIPHSTYMSKTLDFLVKNHKIYAGKENGLWAYNLSSKSVIGMPSTVYDVRALNLKGDSLFIGGDFTQVAGSTRHYFAAIDLANGNSLLPVKSHGDDLIYTMARRGETLAVGGKFDALDMKERWGLAGIDLATNEVTDLSITLGHVTQHVFKMGIYKSKIYFNGSFTAVNGQSRQNIAAVDAKTGVLSSFNPGVNSTIEDYLFRNDTLYIGGWFKQVAGVDRFKIAALDTSGNLLPWNPIKSDLLNNVVHDLEFSEDGSELYVGGRFETLSDSSRPKLASINIASEKITGLKHNIFLGGGNIADMIVDNGKLFMSGNFNSFDGQNRRAFAILDIAADTLLPSSVVFDAPARDLAIDRNVIYVAGNFKDVNNVISRNGIAAVDKNTGELLDWEPEDFWPMSYNSVALINGKLHGGSISGPLYYDVFDLAGQPVEKPGPVSSIVAEPSPSKDKTISVSWTAAINNPQSYLLYRSTSSISDTTGKLIAVLNSSTLTYVDSSLTDYSEYYYRAYAKTSTKVSEHGGEDSAISPDYIIPGSVLLNEMQKDSGKIKLKWTKSSTNDFAMYYIHIDTISSATTVLDSVISVVDTSWSLIPAFNKKYFARVTVKDLRGNKSAYSNELSVEADDNQPPLSLNLSGAVQQDSIFKLSWNRSKAVDFAKYKLYLSISDINNFTVLDSLSSPSDTSFSYIAKSVDFNKNHYFRVTASDSNTNESNFSNTVTMNVEDNTAPLVNAELLFTPVSGLDNFLTLYLYSNESLILDNTNGPTSRSRATLSINNKSFGDFYFTPFDVSKNIYSTDLDLKAIGDFGLLNFSILAFDQNQNSKNLAISLTINQAKRGKSLEMIVSNKFSLVFPGNSFRENTIVYARKLKEKNENYLNTDGEKLNKVSPVFQIASTGLLKADADFNYDLSKLNYSEYEKKKIALYKRGKNSWKYINGKINGKFLQASFNETGIYALFYDKSFIPVPENLALYQNYPNPFNPVTTIHYDLPENSRVDLRIYNILGQHIKTLVAAYKEAGYHFIRWDGRNHLGKKIASGIYIYRLSYGNKVISKKMILMK